MSIRHFRIFIAVAEEENITKAAKKLYLTQPTVSVAIKEIEEHYAARFFERINQRLRITEEGKRFLDYAKHFIAMYDEMEIAFKNADFTGRLRIGASVNIGTYYMPRLIREFQDRYPGIKVQVKINTTAVVEKELLDFQNQAMRTLGFAYKLVDSASEGEIEAIAQEDFIFLGIAAISDPVRPDVPAAVAKCLNAGIDVKIVTGDTPATAREIGRQIGIWKSEDSEEQIITGVDFEKLPDEEAAKRVLKLKIMCRARPTDKQRLVELLKQSGAVVAVTGDGTNDAPALNHADVGLSMGSGTSVAKEASDITLLDDSFNSIATAVMWGRSLYHNIQRFILFQLTINLSALLIVLIGSMFGRELPLTVTQMLWVNMIIDTFAAAALASLPPNPKVMNEMPRKSTDFIISPKMRNYILGIGLSFTVLLLGLMYWFTINDGVMSRHDLSVFFTTFVMLQFWNMFNAKAFMEGRSAFANLKDSKSFLLVALLILIGQYLIVTFGGEMFSVIPLSLKDWAIIIGSSSLVLWIGELFRLFKR